MHPPQHWNPQFPLNKPKHIGSTRGFILINCATTYEVMR